MRNKREQCLSPFFSTKIDDEDYIPAALDYMIDSLAANQNSPTENMIETDRKMKNYSFGLNIGQKNTR